MKETQEKLWAAEVLERNVKKILDDNKYRRHETSEIRSLAQLAKKMGISAPSLTHALKGNPRLDTIEKIAEALNVPIARLFNIQEDIEGYISIKGNTIHFHSLEELQEAIKPKNVDLGLM